MAGELRAGYGTKPYKSIGFGAMEVTKPYKFMGFEAALCGKGFDTETSLSFA